MPSEVKVGVVERIVSVVKLEPLGEGTPLESDVILEEIISLLDSLRDRDICVLAVGTVTVRLVDVVGTEELVWLRLSEGHRVVTDAATEDSFEAFVVPDMFVMISDGEGVETDAIDVMVAEEDPGVFFV